MYARVKPFYNITNCYFNNRLITYYYISIAVEAFEQAGRAHIWVARVQNRRDRAALPSL